jgi:ankyrin repeat protein
MKLGSYANLSTVESDEERLASAIARASLVPEAEEATAFAEVAKLPLALHLCSAAGAEELVSCLLEAGAPRDQCDASGRTPLHWACDGCHTGIVRLLLRP